jgi:hypothetical protein
VKAEQEVKCTGMLAVVVGATGKEGELATVSINI